MTTHSWSRLFGATRVFRTGARPAFLLAAITAGCNEEPPPPPPAPPTVTVSLPVEREVTEYSDFTARLAAVDSVEVRARVWGYLQKVNFKEGDMVKKGDLLFEIDPRTYDAALSRAKAKVDQDRAQLAFDEVEYRRFQELVPSASASKVELDRARSARDITLANIAADEAEVRARQLDLDFTKVLAPIDGRAGRYLVTVGNLVQSGDQAGGTLLTTIVSMDPIYGYFDVDERTVQRVRRLIGDGKLPSHDQASIPVSMALSTEQGFAYLGTVNFVDNQVSAKTATLRARAVFPNQDGMLTPGYFGRVRIPTGPPHRGLLVTDRALDTDQGQKILYVVGQDKHVVARPVKVGALHDGMREISEGIESNDQVIVNGLLQVRPGITVEATLVEMPGLAVRASESPPPSTTAVSKQ